MKESIRRLERDVQDLLEVGSGGSEAQQEALEILDDVEHIGARLHRDEPFARYLQEYIRQQRDAFVSGDRDEPLCECAYPRCDLKRGRVPGVILQSDSAQSGIDEMQARHPEARVLLEAREQWAEMLGEYRSALRQALNELDDPNQMPTA